MKPGDLFREAARGIRLYRLRSVLTAASFAAGTAAAVSLFAITDGARAEILHRIRALGADRVVVRPVGEPARGEAPFLTLGDAEALRNGLPFVREIAPVRWSEANVLLPDQRVTVRVVGTTPGYFGLLRMAFGRGSSFAAEARTANSCVLGAAAARELFPSGDAYGSLVKVGGNWYRVVGVLSADASVGSAAGSEVEGGGREVYLPIASTLIENRSVRQPLREIWLRIDEGVAPETAARILERSLRRRHEGRERFEVATPERLLQSQRAARGLLDLLLGIVAAIAFALGGVGMMSIAWQGVAERTREIAIRRAVGARREEILLQFLLEGAVLAAAGAGIGGIVGAAASGVASIAGGWPWLLSAGRLFLAVAIAVGVGMLSSLYPAYRAAMLDPVTALRFDR
jgi:putative ABC transport system permease protein